MRRTASLEGRYIQYGDTQLAAGPINLPPTEWELILDSFGIRQKPQLSFPLNLPGCSAIEGHIAFPFRLMVQEKVLPAMLLKGASTSLSSKTC